MAHDDININFNAAVQNEHSDNGSFQLALVPNCDRKGGGQVQMNTDFFRVVSGSPGKAYTLAVPPDAPDLSLKDIVIIQAISGRRNLTTPPETTLQHDKKEVTESEPDDELLDLDDAIQNDSIELKAAESGAMDATQAVTVLRGTPSAATTQPIVQVGDAVGWKSSALRNPR